MKIMQFFNYLLALLIIVQCIKAKNRDGPFGELVIINAMIIPGHGGPAYGPADIIIKNDLIDQIRIPLGSFFRMMMSYRLSSQHFSRSFHVIRIVLETNNESTCDFQFSDYGD